MQVQLMSRVHNHQVQRMWLYRDYVDLRHLVLSVLGFIWGLLYGAIMNIYFWPYAMGPSAQTWTPGVGLGETLSNYIAFYLVTSDLHMTRALMIFKNAGMPPLPASSA